MNRGEGFRRRQGVVGGKDLMAFVGLDGETMVVDVVEVDRVDGDGRVR